MKKILRLRHENPALFAFEIRELLRKELNNQPESATNTNETLAGYSGAIYGNSQQPHHHQHHQHHHHQHHLNIVANSNNSRSSANNLFSPNSTSIRSHTIPESTSMLPTNNNLSISSFWNSSSSYWNNVSAGSEPSNNNTIITTNNNNNNTVRSSGSQSGKKRKFKTYLIDEILQSDTNKTEDKLTPSTSGSMTLTSSNIQPKKNVDTNQIASTTTPPFNFSTNLLGSNSAQPQQQAAAAVNQLYYNYFYQACLAMSGQTSLKSLSANTSSTSSFQMNTSPLSKN